MVTKRKRISLPGESPYMRNIISKRWFCSIKEQCKRSVTAALAVTLLVSACPLQTYAEITASAQAPGQNQAPPSHNLPVARTPKKSPANGPDDVQALPDSISIGKPVTQPAAVVEDEIELKDGHLEATPVDTVAIDINRRQIEEEYPDMLGAFNDNDSTAMTAGEILEADSLAMIPKKKPDEWVPRKVEFSPDPTKAVWFAALFPGLGQVYNRRYWTLPIVVGGYLGLAYATNWNNGMLRDYTKAYADLLDNDPDTKSYMDLFAPNVKEENLDKAWLQNVIRSRKNYFRRNRDLCIICMIGVYLIAMVDAYVDASLSHFDITPDLTMDVSPTLIQDGRNVKPSVGLVWAFNF